jgi:hypothetical protein
MNLVIQSLLVLLLFVFSGGEKIFSVEQTSKLLQSKCNLPLALCIIAVLGVIVLELLGSGIIVYSASTNSNKYFAKMSIIGLIIFTILATVLFHMGEKEHILKNLSVIGGLTLLYDRF